MRSVPIVIVGVSSVIYKILKLDNPVHQIRMSRIYSGIQNGNPDVLAENVPAVRVIRLQQRMNLIHNRSSSFSYAFTDSLCQNRRMRTPGNQNNNSSFGLQLQGSLECHSHHIGKALFPLLCGHLLVTDQGIGYGKDTERIHACPRRIAV